MLRNLLIGLEDSAYGAAAVELGIAWCKKFDAQAVALGVIDEEAICAPTGVPIGGSAMKKELEAAQLAECRQRVERLLSQFSLKCCEAGVASKVLEDTGWPHEQLLLEMQRFDIVLLGQQGRFFTNTEEPSARVLEDVLHHTSRPVVAVPQVSRARGQGVLIAYDGSLQAARTVQAFQNAGLAALGPVHIVSIHRDSKVEAAKTADRAAEFLGAHQISTKCHAVHSSAAHGQIILDQAHSLGVDLIVMGCFGKSRWHEFFLGSATRTLLDQADLPLLLYH